MVKCPFWLIFVFNNFSVIHVVNAINACLLFSYICNPIYNLVNIYVKKSEQGSTMCECAHKSEY